MLNLLSRNLCWMLALVVLPATAAMGQEWGTLRGRFVFDGTPPAPAKINVDRDAQVFGGLNLVDEGLVVGPDGGIGNVVVYCTTPNVKISPEYDNLASEKVLLDNKGGRFEPHVATIWLKQTLVLKNSDPVGHNMNMAPLGDTPINPLLSPGAEDTYQFRREQRVPVKVGCNIHPWMGGWVLPRSNPYAVVSGPDGSFEIKNLPTGELKFKLWHELKGYVNTPQTPMGDLTVTIKPGDNDLGEIKLPPSVFGK